MVERVPLMEVERLLRDQEFQALLAHYETLAALPYAERVARLAPMALAILEMGLETGDLRVAMFILHEQHRGHDPAMRIAQRVVERAEAAVQAETPKRERRTPRPPAPPRERPHPWSHCAAIPEHEHEAEALALADLGRVRAETGRMLDRLADRLANESERAGTALGADTCPAHRLELMARGVARYWHGRPAQSLQAAMRLEEARKRHSHGPAPPA